MTTIVVSTRTEQVYSVGGNEKRDIYMISYVVVLVQYSKCSECLLCDWHGISFKGDVQYLYGTVHCMLELIMITAHGMAS